MVDWEKEEEVKEVKMAVLREENREAEISEAEPQEVGRLEGEMVDWLVVELSGKAEVEVEVEMGRRLAKSEEETGRRLAKSEEETEEQR